MVKNILNFIRRIFMSLHDTDKSSLDRGAPTPNSSDVIIDGANKSHKTISSHYGTDADASSGRLQMQNKQVIANDGTTNVGLYGYNPALGKWGFFLTQTGTDVTTNTDLTKFIFNSNQNIFKILDTKLLTVPALSMLNNTSGSNGTPIDLSAYPATAVILPIALQSGQPSFIWQGIQVLSGAIGFAGIVTATYSASFTGGGVYQLTRGISNSASGSTYNDPAYTIKIYILQETIS
jgi:hypothetical protein